MGVPLGRAVTSVETAVAEANAQALGLSTDVLMENAGRVVAEEVVRALPTPQARLAIVAGPGNNGGDGFCAGHYLLEWGYRPEVWLVTPPAQIRTNAARRCYERIARRCPFHIGVPSAEELAAFPLVVDALLGTGQSGTLRSPFREAVRAVRESGVPVLSIDVPTGATDPEGLRPQRTVALAAPKAEFADSSPGEVIVRDIGIPEAAWRETGPGDFLYLRRAGGTDGRGRTGRLVVIGGGPYAGAPALAGLAALRSGAERATIFAPGGAADRIQSFSPNLIVRAFGKDRFTPADVGPMLRYLDQTPPRAVVMGMGVGTESETLEALRGLTRSIVGRYPVVIDADALAVLPDIVRGRALAHPVLATPNGGEFIRVFHGPKDGAPEERRAVARTAGQELGITIVAKGDPDLITDGVEVYENRHHALAMTVGGSGDVLGGVLGSLLAQGLGATGAALLGTYWVGEAGLRVAATKGDGLVATDLIEELPAALVAGLGRVRHSA
ncbi:MAG: NAD(P)H-hydrate dehydratase [Thermoplasmata archaeon]|jgi:ADP-dependent NAD(P)H-hydrate dehydratase / NAD(P)H-hydrate epimerase